MSVICNHVKRGNKTKKLLFIHDFRWRTVKNVIYSPYYYYPEIGLFANVVKTFFPILPYAPTNTDMLVFVNKMYFLIFGKKSFLLIYMKNKIPKKYFGLLIFLLQYLRIDLIFFRTFFIQKYLRVIFLIDKLFYTETITLNYYKSKESKSNFVMIFL